MTRELCASRRCASKARSRWPDMSQSTGTGSGLVASARDRQERSSTPISAVTPFRPATSICIVALPKEGGMEHLTTGHVRLASGGSESVQDIPLPRNLSRATSTGVPTGTVAISEVRTRPTSIPVVKASGADEGWPGRAGHHDAGHEAQAAPGLRPEREPSAWRRPRRQWIGSCYACRGWPRPRAPPRGARSAIPG